MADVVGHWQGTEPETNDLVKALSANCLQNTQNRPCDMTCSAHSLMRSQFVLDRLLFVRRIRARIQVEEHDHEYVHRTEDRAC